MIIGVNAYSGDESVLPRLDYASNDAREIRSLLIGEFGYTDEGICYLAENAGYGAIRWALTDWAASKDIQPSDSFLLFFAGHGFPEKPGIDAWIGGADSRETDELTHVTVTWIRDAVGSLRCKHKLIVLDSCYSGALFYRGLLDPQRSQGSATSTAENNRGPGMSESGDSLAYYLTQPCFFGISAGRDTPVADGEGVDRHSVFTSALLSALKDRADTPRTDHVFTVRQLAAMVEARVSTLRGRKQIPISGDLGTGRGNFIFRPTVSRKTPSESRAAALLSIGAESAIQRGDRYGALVHYARTISLDPDDQMARLTFGTLLANGPVLTCVWKLTHQPISIAFAAKCPDEVSVLTASGAIPTYSAASGALVRTLELPTGSAPFFHSKDGSFVFVKSPAGRLERWDLRRGVQAGELIGEMLEDPRRRGDLSLDGKIMASVIREKVGTKYVSVVQVADIEGGRSLFHSDPAIGDVEWATLDEDATHVAATTFEGATSVYELGTGQLTGVVEAGGRCDRPCLSPAGSILYERVPKTDTIVARYISTGKEVWRENQEGLLSLESCGSRLLSTSASGIQIRLGASGAGLASVKAQGARCKLLRDGHTALVGTHDDGAGGHVYLRDLDVPGTDVVGSGHWSMWAADATGHYVATARVSPDANAESWDVCLWTINGPRTAMVAQPISHALYRELHTLPGAGRAVLMYRADTGVVVECLELSTGRVIGSTLVTNGFDRLLAWTDDGRRVALQGNDVGGYAVEIVDLQAATVVCPPLRTSYQVQAAAFLRSGSALAYGTGDGVIRTWSIDDCKPGGMEWIHDRSMRADGIAESVASTCNISCVGVDAKDRSLVSVGGFDPSFRAPGAAVLWDIATGKELGELAGARYYSAEAAFSPDGRWLEMCSQGIASLWNVDSRESVCATVWPVSGPLKAFEFSPDSSAIVSGMDETAVRFRYSATGMPFGIPLVHEGRVMSARYGRQGSLVVTTCTDGRARIWDAHSGVAVSSWLEHGEGLIDAYFVTDGTQVVTVGEDGTARFWPILLSAEDPEFLCAYAETCAERKYSQPGELSWDYDQMHAWTSLVERYPKYFSSDGALLPIGLTTGIRGD